MADLAQVLLSLRIGKRKYLFEDDTRTAGIHEGGDLLEAGLVIRTVWPGMRPATSKSAIHAACDVSDMPAAWSSGIVFWAGERTVVLTYIFGVAPVPRRFPGGRIPHHSSGSVSRGCRFLRMFRPHPTRVSAAAGGGVHLRTSGHQHDRMHESAQLFCSRTLCQ
jgi:hypothetical protein